MKTTKKTLSIIILLLLINFHNIAQTKYDSIPAPIYTGSTTVCAGELISFDPSSYVNDYSVPDSAALSYAWQFDSCESRNWYSNLRGIYRESMVIPDTSGLFTIYANTWLIDENVSNLYGRGPCTELVLTVLPKPFPELGSDTTIASSYNLNPGIFDSYLWNTGSTSPSLTVANSGKYWVEVTNSSGCVNSDTVNITIDNTTGISELNSQEFSFYPNPVTDGLLTISSNLFVNEITIFDLSGKVLISTSSKNIDVTGLENGTYILQVNNSRKPFVKL